MNTQWTDTAAPLREDSPEERRQRAIQKRIRNKQLREQYSKPSTQQQPSLTVVQPKKTITTAPNITKDDGPNHLRYDSFRIFTNATGHALLNKVWEIVRQHEGTPKYERAGDRQRYMALVHSVLANLVYLRTLKVKPGTGIHVSRAKRVLGAADRYRAQFVGERLIGLLDALDATDLILQSKAEGKGELKAPFSRRHKYGPQTVIYPSGKLAGLMSQYMVTNLSDVAHRETEDSGLEEVVLLREKKRLLSGNPLDHQDAALAQYVDTEVTQEYRRIVRELREWFAQMVVRVIEPECPSSTTGRLIDTRNWCVQRIFTRGRFDSVGRYFRGWWMELSKEERKERIRIDNQRTVELDFSTMMPRLAYAKMGITPPEGDLYAIPGYARSRDAIKIIFSALLFDEANYNRKRLPADAMAAMHPHDWQGKDTQTVITDLKSIHAPLAPLFGSGVGHDLLFMESQILTVILEEVTKRDLSALPIHDALVVPVSQYPVIKGIMERVFEERAGQRGVVKVLK